MNSTTIQDQLALEPDSRLHQKIRRLWMKHSLAEDKRDLDGLISTLSPDCVYEVIPTGERWEGHDGARNFYITLLTAFPDVHFSLTDIVIGPQGVFEVADVTGTHQGPWANILPKGKPFKFKVLIYFPWNPETEKFDGEKVYFDRQELLNQLT